MAAVSAPLSATNSFISSFSPFSALNSPRPSSATAATSVMWVDNKSKHTGPPLTPNHRSFSPKEGSGALKASATDTNTLKSPQTPSVAPSPISSDVGTDFADTEEAVDDNDAAPVPVKVDTVRTDDSSTGSPADGRPKSSPIDRIRSPLTVTAPSTCHTFDMFLTPPGQHQSRRATRRAP